MLYNVTFVMNGISIITTIDVQGTPAEAHSLALQRVNEELGFSISPLRYTIEVEEA
jgi:hypothetical protein